MRNLSVWRVLATAVIGCGAASVAMAQGVMDQMPWDTMEKVTIVTAIGASAIIGYRACEWLLHRARGGKGTPYTARMARQILEELGLQPQRERWPGQLNIPLDLMIPSQDGFGTSRNAERSQSSSPSVQKPRKITKAPPRRLPKRR